MIINGQAIAADIYADLQRELDARPKRPSLLIFACAPNPETQKYLRLKQERALALGIDLVMHEFSGAEAMGQIEAVFDHNVGLHGGVVVQLPFPPTVDVEPLLRKIPAGKDVDAINYAGGDGKVLPPVVGAIREIARRHRVEFAGRQVAVVGAGVTIIDKDTLDTAAALRAADIIISGAGRPGLITPDQIKEGVVLFDAGASEVGGRLRGDADPSAASKCALFTPVPGGIGPVTIAVLLRNLAVLTR